MRQNAWVLYLTMTDRTNKPLLIIATIHLKIGPEIGPGKKSVLAIKMSKLFANLRCADGVGRIMNSTVCIYQILMHSEV